MLLKITTILEASIKKIINGGIIWKNLPDL